MLLLPTRSASTEPQRKQGLLLPAHSTSKDGISVLYPGCEATTRIKATRVLGWHALSLRRAGLRVARPVHQELHGPLRSFLIGMFLIGERLSVRRRHSAQQILTIRIEQELP